jgi:hypothetical protein
LFPVVQLCVSNERYFTRADGGREMARVLRLPLLPAFFVVGCCGCSFAPWLSVPHAKIADDQYTGMSCDELRAENDRLLTEAVDLRPQPTPGEEQRKKDFAYISGEMDALNRVRTAKKC